MFHKIVVVLQNITSWENKNFSPMTHFNIVLICIVELLMLFSFLSAINILYCN